MIEDLRICSPAQVGYYAGLIESLFALATFTTVLAWGTFSDRFGRKRALLLGLAGASLSVVGFGFSSTSLVTMIVFRSLGGLLCGNVAVIKSMLGELTDESNQARAFSSLPISELLSWDGSSHRITSDS